MFKRLLKSFAPARLRWLQKADGKLRQWAAGLQHWFQKYNAKRQRLLLAVFCLLTCSAYGLILWQSFSPKHRTIPVFHAIRYPGHAVETGEPSHLPGRSNAATEAAIIRLRRYTDSLKASPGGAVLLDSFSRAFPGIMDSLDHMEKIYHIK
ncbi:MAG: hypothetical protein BGO55_08825 [Sphingobacteriales bacterium 50-39]|nr:hypothetical protein [Sphingobacteriales bacterium]OJW59366.1 MAG: hypothetical protein BGO55_08825 [Sphingobacteriales bacterium 50-39]